MADTKVSALTAAAALDGTEDIPVVQGGTSKRTTPAALKTYIGDPDSYYVTGTTQNNSTTTPAAVTFTPTMTLGPGVYMITGLIIYQTAATTTGIETYLNFTGTASRVAAQFSEVTTGTTAANGVGEGSTTATAQVMEGKAQRANNTTTGPTQGVDTANAGIMRVIDANLIITASGDLQLMFRSEVAGSQVSIMVGSAFRVSKVADV